MIKHTGETKVKHKHNYSLLKHLDFLILDFICIELAFFIACQIRQATFLDLIERYMFMAAAVAVAFLIIVMFWNIYSGILRRGFGAEVKSVFALTAGIFVSLTVYCFVTKTSEDYSRAVLITFLFIAIPLILIERLVGKELVRKQRSRGAGENLLFAKEEIAEEKIDIFTDKAESGVIVTGIITYDRTDRKDIKGVPIVGCKDDIQKYVSEHKVNCVFVHLAENEINEYVDYLVGKKILVYRVLRNLEKSSYRYGVEEMNGYKTLSIREREVSLGHAITKRIGDIVFSILGIIITLPITIVTAIAIKLEDGGPIFYVSYRVGQYGKIFKMYKFRSMRVDADKLERSLTKEQLEEYKKEYKIHNDQRVTKVGRFIRKYSIDELPQLFNILKGELSFIGPRPVLDDETRLYGDKRDLLLSVRPGLTGYWQAYGRNNITYENGERQAMELYYIEHFSWWFNVKIFFKTIKAVITAEGAE